jgi:predicted nucleic acid-binding protein
MTSQVCVDAGILLKLVLSEPDSDLADRLWRSWLMGGIQPVAPALLRFEVTAVLRKHVHRGTISQATGLAALQKALAFNVEEIDFPEIHLRAFEIARLFNQPTAYDAHYLALSEWLDCEYWTADTRLYNAARNQFSKMHWLGHSPSP